MAYCYKCCVTHRTSYCPKDKKAKEKAMAEATLKRLCAGCEKEKVVPEGDYLCVACRVAQAPKFNVTIPEMQLESLTDTDVQELSTTLLKHGVGFSVRAI